ncbi:23 kDa jasmonate-induced protein [Elaeis guineensis]|uniref:23 kDa jasmonate-induced protein n=1 Tax=Elaeis guineensis var. tenera TaxID=51953 RepID=UPI003C6CC7D1
MASNVFGNPITDQTLRGLPEYKDKPVITATDRATVALNMKNAGNKDVNARKFVENLKERYGNGVSTLCLVYNATGGTLNFVLSHDWHGHIGESPYPQQIDNGQWGAYLHVHTSGAAVGSSAAVVYRGKNEGGTTCDWMFGWSNPWNRWGNDNTVYTEIREYRHYEDNDHWNYIQDKVEGSGLTHSDTWNGCVSTVATGSSTSPILQAILTLENAEGL